MRPQSRGRRKRVADIAALVVVGWLAVFLGAAWVVFERRDA
jgi:ABC-type transport system involved in multi-copper enzyme maturation permease subunit